MFVTCHINFWPLSNFIGVSLEVTRTISNNKVHFTWGCSIMLWKKGKGPWDRILFFFFFNDSDIFLNILILIITSLAIHSGVFWWFYFSLLLSRVTRSRARFALASFWPKNAEKFRLFCRSRPPQWNLGFMVSSFLSFCTSRRMVKIRP